MVLVLTYKSKIKNIEITKPTKGGYLNDILQPSLPAIFFYF